MQKNPIKEIREEQSKTINEMALKLGMTLEVSPKILSQLEELGYDRDEIEQKYREWRESKSG